jgi:hypothetical protein
MLLLKACRDATQASSFPALFELDRITVLAKLTAWCQQHMLLLDAAACLQALEQASDSSSSQKTSSGGKGVGRPAASASEAASHISVQVALGWVSCVPLLAWHLGQPGRERADTGRIDGAAHVLDASGGLCHMLLNNGVHHSVRNELNSQW